MGTWVGMMPRVCPRGPRSGVAARRRGRGRVRLGGRAGFSGFGLQAGGKETLAKLQGEEGAVTVWGARSLLWSPPGRWTGRRPTLLFAPQCRIASRGEHKLAHGFLVRVAGGGALALPFNNLP